MAEATKWGPGRGPRLVAQWKCGICKTVARYYSSDAWTEDSGVYARCVGCGSIMFLRKEGDA